MISIPIHGRAVVAAGVLAMLFSGISPAASAGQGGGGATPRAEPALRATGDGEITTLSARDLPLGGPSVRIYVSVAADGSVAISDQPRPGAKAVQVRTYASASDAPAMATAREQQRHWQEQAQAFEQRLEQRERAAQFERVAGQRPFPSPEYLVTR